MSLLLIGCLGAWKHSPDSFAAAPFDAVLVPGCPATDEGRVSPCQWRRASWAAELIHGGSADFVVVSGGAVYNPYVEADGLALALEALGVAPSRIVKEREARHTDQNAAFSLELLQERGWTRVAVASDGVHAVVIDKMLTEWTGLDVVALPVTRGAEAPLPVLQIPAVSGWLPPDQVDEDRPAPIFSLPVYFWKALTSPLLDHAPPEA